MARLASTSKPRAIAPGPVAHAVLHEQQHPHLDCSRNVIPLADEVGLTPIYDGHQHC